MSKLNIELIDRLNEAASALAEALDVVGDIYGAGDPMFEEIVRARDAANALAERLQDHADIYGEMAHRGL